MEIQLIGGAGEVGASCLVVAAAGRRVLVDAGIRMGAEDALPDLQALQVGGGIDAVVVTHAHADHIGALPLAVGAFPAAPIVATPATAALMRVMLADAVRIGQARAEQDGDLPPYGPDQVAALLERLRPLPIGIPFPLLDGWQLTYFRAGHVLGAAMALLDTPEGTVLLSGDVSVGPQRTVAPAQPPTRRVDVLVLESTYGNRLHASRAVEEARLVAHVQQVLARGGHCLIPAFALGRAQEVLLILAEARRQGQLTAPVWVDGLVRGVCDVYRAHAAEGSPRLRRLAEREGDPFSRPEHGVRFVQRPAEREAILAGPPTVLVASSGMLQGGPSAFYAAKLAPDERHAILITGYQDEEAPGRTLLGLLQAAPDQRRLRLDGREVALRCQVDRYQLSAHADGDELVALAARVRPGLVVLVHGDAAARAALGQKLLTAGLRPTLPANGDTVAGPAPTRRARPPEFAPRPAPSGEQLVALVGAGGERRGWTALELAERYYGRPTPEGVAAIQTLLERGDGFQPVPERPGWYRLRRSAAPVPTASPAGSAAGGREQERVRQAVAAATRSLPGFLKASLYPRERRVLLHVHFPDPVQVRHMGLLEELGRQTGWRIDLHPHPDQGALQAAVGRYLPAGVLALGRASVHTGAQTVAVKVGGSSDPATLAQAAAAYQEETGFRLLLRGEGLAPPAPPAPPAGPALASRRMNANQAFATIKGACRAHGLALFHLGQRGESIELTFLTPALGRRWRSLLATLQEQVGWPLGIAATVPQQPLVQLVRQCAPRRIGKRIAVHPDDERIAVHLRPGEQVSDAERAQWHQAVQDATGYTLAIVAPASGEGTDDAA